ncbi:hypothetical protein D3C71_1317480 [compost metagenome]
METITIPGFDPSSAMPPAAQEPELSLSEMNRRDAKNNWVSHYVQEWARLANGRMDHEIADFEGHALHHVVGHRPPEEVARQHFNSCTGAADSLTSAERKFQKLAAEIGLVHQTQALSPDLTAFAHGVAELCAAVGDRFRDARDGSAGDQIRANYGPVPF